MPKPKTRTDHITELFEALGALEECEYSTQELWDFLDQAVSEKKLRKLSKKKDESTSDSKKKRSKTGYQHFLGSWDEKEYPIPQGENKRTFKGLAWSNLTDEQREDWNQKARLLSGSDEKPLDVYQDELTKWQLALSQWADADPETRGPQPIAPSKQSPPVSGSTSPTTSPTDGMSPATSPPSSPTQLSKALEQLQISSDNDSDEDDENEDEDEDEDDDDDNAGSKRQERLRWLKASGQDGKGLPWKANKAGNFKAYVMFSTPDEYGPGLKNEIKGEELKLLKETFNFKVENETNETGTLWYNFVKNNNLD